MDAIAEFKKEREQAVAKMSEDEALKKLSSNWMLGISRHKYGYNFRWLGRPIIQLPTDIVALQELIWEVKPDLIIETGIAHGGSIIFSASMLELLGGNGCVIGIDIDIREHNRVDIEKHPMFKRITMIQGSSTDPDIVSQVSGYARGKKNIMVFLDSCHTHEHVLRELEVFSDFVTLGSYIIVFDTAIEFVSDDLCCDRPWGVGNNPWTAVQEFLQKNDRFIIDKSIQNKLLVTSTIDGYLKCIK